MNTRDLTRALALAAALSMTACTTSSPTPDDTMTQDGTSTDTARDDATPIDAAELPAAVSAAQRGFAADMLAQASLAAGADGNVFVSPYSIHSALGMTLAGANGETADQMAKTLGISGISAAQRHAAMRAHADALVITDAGPDGGDAFTFSTANRVWTAQGLELLAPFATTTREQYGAEAAPVDFAASEAARKTINAWIAGKTMDKIPELIPSGVLDSDTRLVLTNALYFKGSWKTAFLEAATQDASFSAPGGKVIVPMMRSGADSYPYASSDDYEALSIPYTGGADMLVILPRDGKFAQVSKALEGGGLGKVMSQRMPGREVVIGLPKFTFRIPLGLKESLRALGMTDAFVAGVADFSGMYAEALNEKLHISHVLHEAFVAVDEAGTEAAAATAVVMKIESAPMDPPLQFTADRPFFFVIRHTATNTPLFVGRVMDPSRKK